eukprot:1150773-Pelagomonas_calceolata.AAC.3
MGSIKSCKVEKCHGFLCHGFMVRPFLVDAYNKGGPSLIQAASVGAARSLHLLFSCYVTVVSSSSDAMLIPDAFHLDNKDATEAHTHTHHLARKMLRYQTDQTHVRHLGCSASP